MTSPSRPPSKPQTGLPAAGASLTPQLRPTIPTIREATPSFVAMPTVVPTLSTPPSSEPLDALPRASVPPTIDSEAERQLVRQLRTGRAALPVLPQVAESALRLANDPDARIDQLARLVDTDPPIAARFMSVANSVAYFRGLLTSSTQSAIIRLGLANTRDLLFQVVYASSTHGLKKYQTAVHRSFKRSVMAAIAARAAAQDLAYSGDYDYMCGLLHNIGEARVYRILDGQTQGIQDSGLIKNLVQKYHCVAGAEVAMAWKLPTEIVDCCAAHHDQSAMGIPHIRLVMVADQVVEAMEAVGAGKSPNYAGFEALGLPLEVALTLIQKTAKAFDGARLSLRP